MTLRQLADGIATDAKLLNDQTQLRNQVTEFAELREDLVSLTETLTSTMRLGRVLKDGGIAATRPTPPQDRIDELSALMRDGEFVESPLARARRAMKDLNEWASRTRRELMDRYQSWCDEMLPSLSGAEAFAELLTKVDARAALHIRRLVSDAKLARANEPQTVDDVRHVRELAEKIRTATTEFAPTPETEEFLRDILGPGAPLDALTEDIRIWVHEKDLWSSLRIRLGDVRD